MIESFCIDDVESRSELALNVEESLESLLDESESLLELVL